MRLVINGILYVTVGGIQWRMLPKEYPKWQSIYTYFRQWRTNGIWQRIHDTLRARVRPMCRVAQTANGWLPGQPKCKNDRLCRDTRL